MHQSADDHTVTGINKIFFFKSTKPKALSHKTNILQLEEILFVAGYIMPHRGGVTAGIY